MEANNRNICSNCNQFGLCYNATHLDSPEQFIEGNPDSPIWIIGLNPAGPIGEVELRTLEDLRRFNSRKVKYFQDFAKVSAEVFNGWLKSGKGVAHTDLVKCYTPSFPPKHPETGKSLWGTKDKTEVINNCTQYLKQQIIKYKPRIVVCNGSPVSDYFLKAFPPAPDENNSEVILNYSTYWGDHQFQVFLTGFIGRIDDRSKRRLGIEIEEYLK